MIGETLGSYRIVGRLGAGGMGEVYLAEHARIDRRAAIKVLLPELSHNQEVVDRFFAEARATSSIHHPGIVEVLDCDVHPSGRAYIVMELLEGESLAARLTREPGFGRNVERVLALGGRGRRRDRRRARQGDRPPRSQARQHLPGECAARGDWLHGEDPRLRHRQADRRRRRQPRQLDAHAHRQPAGHAGVHVARAVPRRQPRRPPHGYLFVRLHRLRDARRPAAVHVRRVRRAHLGAHDRDAEDHGRARDQG